MTAVECSAALPRTRDDNPDEDLVESEGTSVCSTCPTRTSLMSATNRGGDEDAESTPAAPGFSPVVRFDTA